MKHQLRRDVAAGRAVAAGIAAAFSSEGSQSLLNVEQSIDGIGPLTRKPLT